MYGFLPDHPFPPFDSAPSLHPSVQNQQHSNPCPDKQLFTILKRHLQSQTAILIHEPSTPATNHFTGETGCTTH